MIFFKRGRLLYWLAKELSRKHAYALTIGFLLGLFSAFSFWKSYRLFYLRFFVPVDRIGIIGIYNPSNLPLRIQKEISFGLTAIASDGSALPSLASSWEATDSGKTYIFHFRDDFVWHNGKKVQSSDLNYNIQSVKFSAYDSKTLIATLEEPYSPFPTLVSKPVFQAGLNGFGIYKVDAIKLKGGTVSYLRLIPYKDMSLPVKEYRFYPNESESIYAYKLGDIDIIENLTDYGQLSKWGKYSIKETVLKDQVIGVFFNLRNEKLKNRLFRHALGYGIPDFTDRQRAFSPISSESWTYNSSVKKFYYDEKQVKKLLKEINLPQNTNLVISVFSQYYNDAEQIAQSWTLLGIPTVVRVENIIPDSFEVFVGAQNIPPDPDEYPFWHSTQTETNIIGYANIKIDKLLEDGRKELDKEKRRQIYLDFQKYFVDDAPVIFLYYPARYTIKRL